MRSSFRALNVFVVGLLEFSTIVFAAPSASSYPTELTTDTLPERWALPGSEAPMEVLRINLEDYQNENGTAEYRSATSDDDLYPSNSLAKRWVHWEATVQAWRSSQSCSGSPAASWFPATFARRADVGHARCYEIFENGERQTINSIHVTGPWGPNPCYIAGYRSGTCNTMPYTEIQLKLVGKCNTKPSGYSFQSFMIQCF